MCIHFTLYILLIKSNQLLIVCNIILNISACVCNLRERKCTLVSDGELIHENRIMCIFKCLPTDVVDNHTQLRNVYNLKCACVPSLYYMHMHL